MHLRSTIRAATAAVLLAGLAACSSDDDSGASSGNGASGEEPMSISVGVIASADHTPMWVAEEMGFFEDRNIEVDIQTITPGAGIMQAAMDAGDIHAGENTPFLAASATQAGSPIQLFCGSWKAINHSIVVRADSDIPTADEVGWEAVAEALEGTTIGVAAIGSNSQRWVELMLSEAGVDPGSVDFVQAGAGPASIEPLNQGTVDAVASYPWFTEQFETSGVGKAVVVYSDNGPETFRDQQQNSWVAPKEWLDANPETAAVYCEAIDEANRFIADPANAERVAEILRDVFQLDDDDLIAALMVEGGALDLLDTGISCSGLENTLDFLVETEQLSPSDDLTCDALIWADAPRAD